MRWKRLSRLGLAQRLLLLLLPALLPLSFAELQWTACDVHRAAHAAYDRSLLGALKSVDASVSTESVVSQFGSNRAGALRPPLLL